MAERIAIFHQFRGEESFSIVAVQIIFEGGVVISTLPVDLPSHTDSPGIIKARNVFSFGRVHEVSIIVTIQAGCMPMEPNLNRRFLVHGVSGETISGPRS